MCVYVCVYRGQQLGVLTQDSEMVSAATLLDVLWVDSCVRIFTLPLLSYLLSEPSDAIACFDHTHFSESSAATRRCCLCSISTMSHCSCFRSVFC